MRWSGWGAEGIGMDLAEQLERLGPFGKGNPGPRLLVPSGRLREVRPLGEEGKHSRFQLESGTGRAMGVAFGMNGQVSRSEDEQVDLSVRLEVDRWNGAVQPRVVVRELYPRTAPEEDGARSTGCGAEACPAPAAEWWQRLNEELARTADGRPGGIYDARPAEGAGARAGRSPGHGRGRRPYRADLQRGVGAGSLRRRIPAPGARRGCRGSAPLRRRRSAARVPSLRLGGARRRPRAPS